VPNKTVRLATLLLEEAKVESLISELKVCHAG